MIPCWKLCKLDSDVIQCLCEQPIEAVLTEGSPTLRVERKANRRLVTRSLIPSQQLSALNLEGLITLFLVSLLLVSYERRVVRGNRCFVRCCSRVFTHAPASSVSQVMLTGWLRRLPVFVVARPVCWDFLCTNADFYPICNILS